MLHNESVAEPLPRLGLNVFINPCVCSFAERTKYKSRALVTDKNIRLVHWISFLQVSLPHPAATAETTVEVRN
jgi:hypothetical protein